MPPRNAKQDPTRDEIAQQFPRIFRYYALESGRWALTYSCYTGQDYSGRWGNYFAHSLIGDDGAPPFWPIDYYEWEGWETSLPPDEDTEEAPAPLPVVNLDAISPSESFTFSELKEFLREVPGREALLADMLRAVFLRTETSRALVIRDSFLNGLFWIACLQKAIPFSCLADLSFSTYQYDDRNCSTINATTEGTDFQFSEAQRKYQFFMFDFTNGEHSEVPRGDLDYPEIIAGWMADNPARLREFHDFVALFDRRQLNPNLVWAARLFQLSAGDGPPIATGELLAIIRFVSQFSAGQDRIVELLAKLTPTLRQAASSDVHEALIRYFAEVAKTSGKQTHRQLAFAAWISMFDSLVFRLGRDTQQVGAMRTELLESFGSFEHELAGLFLSDNHMKGIRESVSELDPNVLEEILRMVLASLDVLGKTPVWKQLEAKSLISAIVSSREDAYRSALRVFDLVTPDPEGLVEICNLIAAKSKGAPQTDSSTRRRIDVGRALGSVLARLPSDLALGVRQQLDKPDTWNILDGEWLELLDRSDDKRKLHEDYVLTGSRYFPGYTRGHHEQLARSLMRVLPSDQQRQQAMDWISSKHTRDSSEAFVKECLTLANLDLPFDPKSPNALKNAKQLAETAEAHGVRLSPDRPFLLGMIVRAQRGDVSLMDLPLEDIRKALAAVDASSYTVFLANFLWPALARARKGREHQRMLSTVYNHSYYDRFKSSYLDSLKERVKKPFTLSDEATLVFWLARLWKDRSLPGLGDLEGDVLNVFLKRVVALDEEQYEVLNRHMWRRNDELDRAAFDDWKWIGNHRGARHGSFFGGLRSRRKS